MHTHVKRMAIGIWIQGETKRAVARCDGWGEKEREREKELKRVSERTSERARSRHAAAVWRQGSPCSLKQSRRMPPTLADRPIVPFLNLPASREPAAFPLFPSYYSVKLRSCDLLPLVLLVAACAMRGLVLFLENRQLVVVAGFAFLLAFRSCFVKRKF